MHHRRFISLPILGLAFVLGCGNGSNIVTVSGVATYKGEPMPGLELNFQPEVGRPSWGHTDAQGRFTLEYDVQNKGALRGKHTVSAKVVAASADEEMGMVKGNPNGKEIQSKYGDMANSPLKIEITEATDKLEVKFE